MAPHDEEDDPAIYRSGSSRKSSTGYGQADDPSQQASASNAPITNGTARDEVGSDANEDGDEDEDDSTLLTVHPGFNRLLMVLRDERVMHFVKYVSAAATGSRWDVCGEFEIGMILNDEEED